MLDFVNLKKGEKMAILVAFETVFGQCSLAIMQDGAIIYEKTVVGARGQTEIILEMLSQALASANILMDDIQVWAFNRGPGAFSGIRINTAVVQALSIANDAPCVGVSSLMALVYCAHKRHSFHEGMRLMSVMDARQNQVYLGCFLIQDGQICPVACPTVGHHRSYLNECLMDYGSLVECDVLLGDGVDLLQTDAKTVHVCPNACDIAYVAWQDFLAGKAVSAEYALPVYLRDNAWKTLSEQGLNKTKDLN